MFSWVACPLLPGAGDLDCSPPSPFRLLPCGLLDPSIHEWFNKFISPLKKVTPPLGSFLVTDSHPGVC